MQGYHWRVRCITEAAYVDEWALDKPTECPNNPAHTIDVAATAITANDLGDSYHSSDGESSTNSVSWVQKLNAQEDLPAGDYDINWTYEISVASVGYVAIVQIQRDNTETLGATKFMPDHTGWESRSGSVRLTLTKGTHDFDIDFASGVDKQTVSIRRARITIAKAAE